MNRPVEKLKKSPSEPHHRSRPIKAGDVAVKRRVGRPQKYGDFICLLDDDEVFTPATIVANGEAHGLFPEDIQPAEKRKMRMRIRHTLSRFSANHHFPWEGDGFTRVKGQPPLRGWKGKRWKGALANSVDTLETFRQRREGDLL